MFVELTTREGTALWVNFNHVHRFYVRDGMTLILEPNSSYIVREKPDEIMSLLADLTSVGARRED